MKIEIDDNTKQVLTTIIYVAAGVTVFTLMQSCTMHSNQQHAEIVTTRLKAGILEGSERLK